MRMWGNGDQGGNKMEVGWGYMILLSLVFAWCVVCRRDEG